VQWECKSTVVSEPEHCGITPHLARTRSPSWL